MGAKTQSGFTIVETMIFLGVSGLLLAGLLAGTTVTIQRQRYSDSVNTTQSFIQQQYSEALNVVNAREGTEACSASNVVVPAAGSPELPGTSDCLVLGRAIDVSAGTGKAIAYHVVGRASSTAENPDLTDDQLLQQYRPTLVKNVAADEFDVPWGAKIIAMRQVGAGAVNRLLMLRSPRSGAIYTYAYDSLSGQSDATSGVSIANRSSTVSICIQSADIVSSTSVVSVSMSGGPEAVKTAFDIPNAGEQC
jgi:type II secretory pathway pseudopilin PulG